MDDLLRRSIVDERVMLLAHRKALQTALEQISALAAISVARTRKNESLLEIGRIADAALLL